MKKYFLLSLLLLVALTVLLCSCEGSGSTSEDTTASGDAEITTDPPETTTEKKEAEEIMIDLSFTEENLCSSAYDPQSGNSEGAFSVYSRWYSTDYIDVSAFYGFYYELASHKFLKSVAFYDENHRYLQGIGTTGTSDAAGISGFVARPEGAKYMRCLTFIGIGSYTAYATPGVKGFATEEDYRLALAKYPHHSLTVACIGDSLTEGDIGSFHGGAAIDYRNYPYYLAKRLGNTVINYGKCGYTAQMIFDSYRKGNIDITEADVIVIMLGTNAGLKLGGTAQFNSYRLLLNAIKSDMKAGAKIILVTPPYASEIRPNLAQYVLNSADATAAVFELAEEFSLPVIDAHNNSPLCREKEMTYQPNDGLHMCTGGYEVFADFICDEMLKILESK